MNITAVLDALAHCISNCVRHLDAQHALHSDFGPGNAQTQTGFCARWSHLDCKPKIVILVS
jgi:hypothetical protein